MYNESTLDALSASLRLESRASLYSELSRARRSRSLSLLLRSVASLADGRFHGGRIHAGRSICKSAPRESSLSLFRTLTSATVSIPFSSFAKCSFSGGWTIPWRTNPRWTIPRRTNPRRTNPRRTNPRRTNPRRTNPIAITRIESQNRC